MSDDEEATLSSAAAALMDADELTAAIEDLLAYLNGLGAVGSDGVFLLGERGIACLNAINKVLGMDDLATQPLHSKLGAWDFAPTRAVPIVLAYRDRPDVLFPLVRVLVRLTEPLQASLTQDRVARRRHQQQIKLSFANKDVLVALLSLLEQPLLTWQEKGAAATPSGDMNTIELYLVFFRNLLIIPEPADEDAHAHDRLLLALHQAEFFPLLTWLIQLSTASGTASPRDSFSLLLLEMVYNVFRLEEPADFFGTGAQASVAAGSVSSAVTSRVSELSQKLASFGGGGGTAAAPPPAAAAAVPTKSQGSSAAAPAGVNTSAGALGRTLSAASAAARTLGRTPGGPVKRGPLAVVTPGAAGGLRVVSIADVLENKVRNRDLELVEKQTRGHVKLGRPRRFYYTDGVRAALLSFALQLLRPTAVEADPAATETAAFGTHLSLESAQRNTFNPFILHCLSMIARANIEANAEDRMLAARDPHHLLFVATFLAGVVREHWAFLRARHTAATAPQIKAWVAARRADAVAAARRTAAAAGLDAAATAVAVAEAEKRPHGLPPGLPTAPTYSFGVVAAVCEAGVHEYTMTHLAEAFAAKPVDWPMVERAVAMLHELVRTGYTASTAGTSEIRAAAATLRLNLLHLKEHLDLVVKAVRFYDPVKTDLDHRTRLVQTVHYYIRLMETMGDEGFELKAKERTYKVKVAVKKAANEAAGTTAAAADGDGDESSNDDDDDDDDDDGKEEEEEGEKSPSASSAAAAASATAAAGNADDDDGEDAELGKLTRRRTLVDSDDDQDDQDATAISAPAPGADTGAGAGAVADEEVKMTDAQAVGASSAADAHADADADADDGYDDDGAGGPNEVSAMAREVEAAKAAKLRLREEARAQKEAQRAAKKTEAAARRLAKAQEETAVENRRMRRSIAFDVTDFVSQFAQPQIVRQYIEIAAEFRLNSELVNECVYKMLARIAFDLELPAMLAHGTVLLLVDDLLHEPLVRKTPSLYRAYDWAKRLGRSLADMAARNSLFYVEALSWMTERTARYAADPTEWAKGHMDEVEALVADHAASGLVTSGDGDYGAIEDDDEDGAEFARYYRSTRGGAGAGAGGVGSDDEDAGASAELRSLMSKRGASGKAAAGAGRAARAGERALTAAALAEAGIGRARRRGGDDDAEEETVDLAAALQSAAAAAAGARERRKAEEDMKAAVKAAKEAAKGAKRAEKAARREAKERRAAEKAEQARARRAAGGGDGSDDDGGGNAARADVSSNSSSSSDDEEDDDEDDDNVAGSSSSKIASSSRKAPSSSSSRKSSNKSAHSKSGAPRAPKGVNNAVEAARIADALNRARERGAANGGSSDDDEDDDDSSADEADDGDDDSSPAAAAIAAAAAAAVATVKNDEKDKKEKKDKKASDAAAAAADDDDDEEASALELAILRQTESIMASKAKGFAKGARSLKSPPRPSANSDNDDEDGAAALAAASKRPRKAIIDDDDDNDDEAAEAAIAARKPRSRALFDDDDDE